MMIRLFFLHVLLLLETNLLTPQKNLLSQDASFVFFLLADFSQTISFIVLRGKKKKSIDCLYSVHLLKLEMKCL